MVLVRLPWSSYRKTERGSFPKRQLITFQNLRVKNGLPFPKWILKSVKCFKNSPNKKANPLYF